MPIDDLPAFKGRCNATSEPMGLSGCRCRRRLLSFAERHLPLDAIAKGPKNDLGLGPEFKAHSCLDFVVQEMKRPDIWSPRLVAVALRSPLIRNRSMAINALKTHRRAEWSDELVHAVGRTLEDEPDPKLRESLASATASE